MWHLSVGLVVVSGIWIKYRVVVQIELLLVNAVASHLGRGIGAANHQKSNKHAKHKEDNAADHNASNRSTREPRVGRGGGRGGLNAGARHKHGRQWEVEGTLGHQRIGKCIAGRCSIQGICHCLGLSSRGSSLVLHLHTLLTTTSTLDASHT